MHGCPDYPGCPETPYTAWIYKSANHPSNPETEATIISTGICPAGDDYFYVNFSGYWFNNTDTVWFGIGWTHPAGAYPCGFDTDSCIAGKSDWLWFPGGQWYELGGIGYPGNWDFEVLIDCGGPFPPTTTCTLTGTYPVIVALTAHAYESYVAFTVYKLDDGPLTNYTVPFDVYSLGYHTFMFYSVNNYGQHEVPKYMNFTVTYPITITVEGGRGITLGLHNTGNNSIEVNGSIVLSGIVYPRTKIFNGIVPVDNPFIYKENIIGFGPIKITVVVNPVKKIVQATVFLFHATITS